jgi:hypothetical protein
MDKRKVEAEMSLPRLEEPRKRWANFDIDLAEIRRSSLRELGEAGPMGERDFLQRQHYQHVMLRPQRLFPNLSKPTNAFSPSHIESVLSTDLIHPHAIHSSTFPTIND